MPLLLDDLPQVTKARESMMIKSRIKHMLRALGWDIRKFPTDADPYCQLARYLNAAHVDLVFDIGANVGQFAKGLRSFGFKGDIVSFEPLSEAHAQLTRAAAADSRWTVHERSAIGDQVGEVEINVAGNSVSSSLLPMESTHLTAAPLSAYTSAERTPITRLDQVAGRYIRSGSRYFIKIDTQGYEWQVLDGSADTIKAAQGALCELSLLPLYDGQHLWRALIDRMEKEGFVVWALQPAFTDPQTGRTLQVDAVFVRQ